LTGKLVKVPPAGESLEIGKGAQRIVKVERNWGNLSKGKKEIEGRIWRRDAGLTSKGGVEGGREKPGLKPGL
jgi:hypothetical protein